MNFIWVLLSYILQLYLNPVAPQQYYYYNEAPQQYDELNDNGHYNEISDNQIKRSAIRRSRFTESEECYCTCERCFDGREKPCCDEFCRYCSLPQYMPMGNIDQYGAFPPAEQKVVFVPFPYPLIVPDEITSPPLTTLENTTPRPTTTTPRPTTTTPKTTATTPIPTITTTKITRTIHKPMAWKYNKIPFIKSRTKSTTKTKKTHTTPLPKRPKKIERISGYANDLEYDILTRRRQLMKLNPVLERHRPTWVPKHRIVPSPYLIN